MLQITAGFDREREGAFTFSGFCGHIATHRDQVGQSKGDTMRGGHAETPAEFRVTPNKPIDTSRTFTPATDFPALKFPQSETAYNSYKTNDTAPSPNMTGSSYGTPPHYQGHQPRNPVSVPIDYVREAYFGKNSSQ